ncbi:MAG: hypothetical protein ACI4XR_01660 [Bacilli bacterium]
MTKRKRKLRKKALFCIILLIISIILYILIFHSSAVVSIIKKTETTSKFDYTLEKRDTSLMKENFKELDKILSEETINYESYAQTLSKLFIIDLYTIDNKKNMYDVGSLEYVYDKDNFKINAQNTIYKYIEDENTRKSGTLPIVKSINIDEKSTGTFDYNENTYDSYIFNLSWTYEKDLGYDNKGKVEIIKIEDKLYVVSFSPEVE